MIAQEKPIVFFDLEATGLLTSEDRIVDISLVKRFPDGREEIFSSLVNPGMPIPEEAQAIHHISDKMVFGAPTFKDLAAKLEELFRDSDLGGFGILKFDIPMLSAEFKRAGVPFSRNGRRIFDAMAIYHRMQPRTLSAAYQFYCGKTLEDSHRAEPDAKASAEVFWAQLERYKELPQTWDALSGFCTQSDVKVDEDGKFLWRNGRAVFNFGKYRLLFLDEVARRDPAYLMWLSTDAKASESLAGICKDALAGKFPVKAETL